MTSLILITMDNGRGHCAHWQSCKVPNQTHRGMKKIRKMYAIKQIKICAEYRDMLPRPWLDLSGTPGLRPIGLSRLMLNLYSINFLKPDDPYMRQWTGSSLVQGWGLLSQFLPFRYFLNFSSLSKHTLAVKYRVYIWQVSPQLSCGDTCQIWMWFVESNIYFCKIEYFAYGEINERSFSNPHPRWCFVTCSVPSNYQSEACYIVNRVLKTNI